MSSDEDADINRLRSDLIKSIRSKKSSRVNSNASTSSSPSATKSKQSGATKKNSAILDTDMDDLEALRRAALVTLKKSKEPSLSQVASSGSTNTLVPPGTNPTIMPYPTAPAAVPFNPHRFYVPPPVLLGPSASFSQFPAPPPAYQSRFLNHTTAGFRNVIRPAPRSNLIVIQTMPRPEDQPREPPSSFSSGKLILPQDRYTRRVNDAGSDKEKRKRDDKWSRFENSSSESSSSSTSPASSDAESDAEEEPSKRSSDDGASDGSAGEEEARRTPIPESTESPQDMPFEGVVIDESVSEEHSDGEAPNEIETGPENQMESPESERQPSPSPQSSEEEEELLLEEPGCDIEFIDEPVDDELMQQLMVDSPALSESVSTPEPVQLQRDEPASDSPKYKELKKQLSQQQPSSSHRNSTKDTSESRRNRDSDSRRDHHHRRSPKGNAKANESPSKYPRRDEERRHHRHRSPDQKQVLSSVVALSSGHGGGNHRSKRPETKRSTNSDFEEAERARKRHRGHSSDNEGGDRISRSPYRSVRNADSDDGRKGKALDLPSAGEDLRKFLQKKKVKAGSGNLAQSNESRSNVRSMEEGAETSRPISKMISLKKPPSDSVTSSPGKEGNLVRLNGNTADHRDVVPAVIKPSIKDRLSLPRDGSAKSLGERRYEMGQGTIDEDSSHVSSRLGDRWRPTGATAKEGTSSSGIGQKVKLKKRPY